MLGDRTVPDADLYAEFPQSAFKPISAAAPYPVKDFLGEQRVYAYRLQFMVTVEDVDRVAQQLGRHFPGAIGTRFQEGPASGADGSIRYSSRPEFGGAVVELVTNSITFIASLDALHLRPPAPWIVFPNVDAAAVGALQGDLDYWWTWFWLPYWQAAPAEERQQLLAQAPEDWRDFFESHS